MDSEGDFMLVVLSAKEVMEGMWNQHGKQDQCLNVVKRTRGGVGGRGERWRVDEAERLRGE